MAKVEKATEITNARIQYVSLVDKAANGRTFLLKKEDGGKAAFSTFGRIIKTDADNHYVTGIVYEPMVEDSQGDFMGEAEITKAAYYFAKNGNGIDIQHDFKPFDGAAVVENWIAKADFEIDGEAVRKGTWLMTVEVTDPDVWNKIEKGEISGFSMGGVGEYSEEDVDLNEVEKAEKKGLLKKIAAALGVSLVEKGAMAELFEERSKGSLFWNAMNTLEDLLYGYDNLTGRWRYETDEGLIRECLEDFNKIITDILTGKESIVKAIQADRPVEKAGKKMSSKNRETLSGIYESLGMFLKEFDDPEDDPDGKKDGEETGEPEDGKSKTDKEEKEVTKQEIEQIVSAAIEKAMGGAQQSASQETQSGTGAVKKAEGGESSAASEITQEAVEKMVEAAVEKALEPQEERLSAEQVEEMIAKAVERAVEPVLKNKGLPSNLNGSSLEKAADGEHYLHGIL